MLILVGPGFFQHRASRNPDGAEAASNCAPCLIRPSGCVIRSLVHSHAEQGWDRASPLPYLVMWDPLKGIWALGDEQSRPVYVV